MEQHMTLMIFSFPGAFDRALEYLGPGLFDDNGGDPDGNAWLPAQPVSTTDCGVAEVLDEGLGKMVRATFTTATDILRANHFPTGDVTTKDFENWLREADPDEIYAEARAIIETTTEFWAGYGGGDRIVYAEYSS